MPRDHSFLTSVPESDAVSASSGTGAERSAPRGVRRRNPLLSVGFILLMLGLIAFAVYQCARHLTVDLNTLRTQQITDTVYADLELYVFRDEAAVSAGAGNLFLYGVQDGEKVAVGARLFDAYRAADGETAALQAQLELYGTRIAQLERTAGSGAVSATALLAEAEKQYREALAATAAGNMQGTTQSGEALVAALNAYHAAANGDSLQAGVEALRAEQAALVADLTPVGTQSTDRAGWFFYESDGLEGLFTVEQALSLTPDSLSALAARLEQSRDGADPAAGRMLYSSLYYLAATLPAAEATGFEEGASYRVYCGDAAGSQMLLTCERCETVDGETLLVFSTQDAPTLVTGTRRLTVQLVLESTTGYRVPTGALVRVTSPTTGEIVTGVYILGGNRVELARIEIAVERDGYVIAKTEDVVQAELDDEEADPAWVSAIEADGWSFLKLNDRMITGGRNLYEGKVIS